MRTRRMHLQQTVLLIVAALSIVTVPKPSEAACPRPGSPPPDPHTCPLVLDLNGDGIYTTSIDNPVLFDFDGDGLTSPVTWINPDTGDVFLVLDLDGSGTIDSGRELFGNSTLLPDGSQANHGFEALAIHDKPSFGGNGDGTISPRDAIWKRLQVWSDLNYNGSSEAFELSTLEANGVVEIGLRFAVLNERDGNLNHRWLVGSFITKIESSQEVAGRKVPPLYRARAVEDIFFYSNEP